MVTLNARDVELVNVISSQIRGEFLRFLPEYLSSFGQFFLFRLSVPTMGKPLHRLICIIALNEGIRGERF